MVKHIIIWSLKSTLSASEKDEAKANIKEKLEGLEGNIEGLLSARVYTNLLDSSSGDLLFISEFTDENALKAYQIHPKHIAISEYVSTVREQRNVADFEVY